MARQTKSTRRPLDFARNGVVVLLVFTGSILFGLFQITSWLQTQLLDRDQFITNIQAAPRNDAVATALAEYINSRIFDNQRVESQVRQALPERASFLARPLTSQLQTSTERATKAVIGSDAFVSIWISANQLAHNNLVAQARNNSYVDADQPSRFSLALDAVTELVRQRTTDTDSYTAVAPQNARLNLNIALQTKATNIRQLVRLVDNFYTLLPPLTILCFLSAIYLGQQRRKTIVSICASIAILNLLILATANIVRTIILNAISSPTYSKAAGVVLSSMIVPLRNIVIGWLILSVSLCILTALLTTDRLKVINKFLPKSQAGFWWSQSWGWMCNKFNNFRHPIVSAPPLFVLCYLAFSGPIQPVQALQLFLYAAVVSVCLLLISDRLPGSVQKPKTHRQSSR